jgi:hypothetical protein
LNIGILSNLKERKDPFALAEATDTDIPVPEPKLKGKMNLEQ